MGLYGEAIRKGTIGKSSSNDTDGNDVKYAVSTVEEAASRPCLSSRQRGNHVNLTRRGT